MPQTNEPLGADEAGSSHSVSNWLYLTDAWCMSSEFSVNNCNSY